MTDLSERDARIIRESKFYQRPTHVIARAFKDAFLKKGTALDAWKRETLCSWLQRHIPSCSVSNVAERVLAYYRRHGWITSAENGWYAFKTEAKP